MGFDRSERRIQGGRRLRMRKSRAVAERQHRDVARRDPLPALFFQVLKVVLSPGKKQVKKLI